LNQQPTEESAFLLRFMIQPTEFNQEIASEICAWCASCLDQFHSPIEISTLMFLMARAIHFFEDDGLGMIAGVVVEALSCGDEMCVLICTALKVFRRLLERGVQFSADILGRIVDFAHICPTGDATKALSTYVQCQREEALQFASEVFESLLEAIASHLQTQVEDAALVNNLLVVLSQLIQASNGLVFQESSFPIFAELLGRFPKSESAFELGLCFTAVFSTDSPHCLSFLGLLFDGIQSNPLLAHGFCHIAPAIQLLLTRVFASIDLLAAVTQISLDAFARDVDRDCEKAAGDLLCAIVQTNPPLDFAPVAEVCARYRFQGRILLVASLYVVGRIDLTSDDLQDVCAAVEKAVCPYEKLLLALVLIQVLSAHPELVSELAPIMLGLLTAEREQRAQLANCQPAFPCSHFLPFPVEGTDISGVLASLVPMCPPEIQAGIITLCADETLEQ
jgi:hypothetical protein